MKFLKLSSIFIFTTLLLLSFSSEASARHHCKSRSSFGLSFNIGGPSYVAPAPAPVVVAPAPVYPVGYPVPAPVYYQTPTGYYYSAPVVVERRPSVYVQPGFSYSFWR